MAPNKQDKLVKDLMLGLGSLAEMAHAFYNLSKKSGATTQEANVAMTALIQAFWHESMQDARASRAKQKQEGQNEADQLDP